MIKALHFESHFVRPALVRMAIVDPRLGSEPAVMLMMGTAAQESDLGYYLRQHPTGPGKGFWSIEDATHDDVWRYLDRPDNAELARIVKSLARSKNGRPPHTELINNPLYSCAIARIKYWMIPIPMPTDLEGLAGYWDKYFNANDNYGTVEEFLDSYDRFVRKN